MITGELLILNSVWDAKTLVFFCLLYRALKSIVGLYLINPSDYMQYGNINWNDIRVILKSCPVGPELHLSFDASSPPDCCPQSHEILLNKGMKYGDSGLNAPGLRTFIVPVHIQLLDFIRDNVCSYLRFWELTPKKTITIPRPVRSFLITWLCSASVCV